MRIMHTADIHLHREHPQRLEALEQILLCGREENIQLLLIAGDLFDSVVEAEFLRPQVRQLFDDPGYPILAIPGNHDAAAYSAGYYFGGQFEALTGEPLTIRDYPEYRLVAVPYRQGSFTPLISELRQAVNPDINNILLLHCTWSLPHYTNSDYGCPDEERYLPVTADVLDGLGYQFILAGHFHTRYQQHRLPSGTIFVYPGAPVSITSREQGQRKVNLLVDGSCNELELATWHHTRLEYTISPENQEHILNQIISDLAKQPDYAQVSLVLNGYIRGSEEQYRQQVTEMANSAIVQFNLRGIAHILDDPLYCRFRELLESEVREPSLRRRALELALNAFSADKAGTSQ
ncbi:MAG: hypothetical protein FH749_08345 [Firmicutes bacterium]|nr:hypothetical protein [Bacillota bacterium]